MPGISVLERGDRAIASSGCTDSSQPQPRDCAGGWPIAPYQPSFINEQMPPASIIQIATGAWLAMLRNRASLR